KKSPTAQTSPLGPKATARTRASPIPPSAAPPIPALHFSLPLASSSTKKPLSPEPGECWTSVPPSPTVGSCWKEPPTRRSPAPSPTAAIASSAPLPVVLKTLLAVPAGVPASMLQAGAPLLEPTVVLVVVVLDEDVLLLDEVTPVPDEEESPPVVVPA